LNYIKTKSKKKKINLGFDMEILDGGFVFELNKKYDDCGIYAMEHDWESVKEIH
jgi:hypothetical protein